MQEAAITASLKMTAQAVNVFYGEKQAIKNVRIKKARERNVKMPT